MNEPGDSSEGPVAEAPTLTALLRALIEDAQTLFEAESCYLRAVAGYAFRSVRAIAMLAVLALFFVFFTLMAVVVGLLLALAPLLGTWGALGAVALLLGGLAAWCVLALVRRSRRMMRHLTGTTDGSGGT